MSRRSFLKRAGGAAAVAGTGALLLRKDSFETPAQHTDSGYFVRQLMWHGEQFAEEMPIILERTEVLEKIREHFAVTKLPEIVQKEFSELIYGLAVEESRLDCDAKSSVGAFGCLQIMPETWNENASEGADRTSLTEQIKVAARLFERTYAHLQNTCPNELAHVKQVFFDNNDERFEREFLTPLLINAYNAGMGSMAMLLTWFVATYPTKESLRNPLEEDDSVFNGYDVFVFLAHVADQEKIITWYKEKSADYAFKVYAASDELRKALSDEKKKELGIDVAAKPRVEELAFVTS